MSNVDVLLEVVFQRHEYERCAGSGRTTKETAAALFLSPKTVEYHLRHIYQKLGIRSRSELADVVAAEPR